MEKHCSVCGNAVHSDDTFCAYCGVALDTEDSMKAKNDSEARANSKRQMRFLAIFSLVLIVAVLAYRMMRADSPTVPDSPVASTNFNLEGRWLGTTYGEDGDTLEYEIVIKVAGDEISGWAVTADETGGADALIRGSYEDGLLTFEEYGGGESGDWVGQEMCFWEMELEVIEGNGEPYMAGTYQGMGCDSAGTVVLYYAP